MDSLEKSSYFHSQIKREQELNRLGINIIRQNLCDTIILQEIVKANNIKFIINAATHCQNIISNLTEYKKISIINISKIINIKPHLPSDYPQEIPVTKRYLLISTFYVAQKDPLHSSKVHYTYGADWCRRYIKPWYNSFKTVTNISNFTESQYDVVIIHDGLNSEVMEIYFDVIFVNMGQYPVRKLRESANDVRYYHMVKYLKTAKSMEYELVLTTDLRDVEFGKRDPFQYLENKNILNGKDIYVGAEDTKKDDKKAYKRWGWWVQNRINQCYLKGSNMSLWFKETWNDSNSGVVPTNPGIIATNTNLMIKLMEVMIDYFSLTESWDSNCNFPIFFIAVMKMCEEKKQCRIVNDKRFHSPFRKFLLKYMGDRPRTYIIYHK